MNIKRLPIAFLVAGLVLKTLVLVGWKLWKFPSLLNLAIYYDPGAFHFAERAAGLFFDQRRLAPTPGESALFHVFLIIGFGIECFLIGFLCQWLLRRFHGRGASSTTTTH
jgi:hypothetical protein